MTRDLDLERRVLDLRALATEQLSEPPQETVAWLICDRCGMHVRLSDDPRRPMVAQVERWGNGPEGDLCPTCADGP